LVRITVLGADEEEVVLDDDAGLGGRERDAPRARLPALLVQRSFLMESSLIAILGLIIGTLVGVWQSYRFFVIDKNFGTVILNVPVVQIALILVGAYLATLVTTYLPARSASRIAPAEALRYE
jgi:ABC-type lipoprotein release transport system permease subunit